MKKELAEQILSNVKNGAYINIHMARSAETYKKLGELNIMKDTTSVVRLGVHYSRIQDEKIQSKVQAGEDTSHLPWGQWVEGSRYLIEHNGKFYLRCTVSRSPKHHSKVTYYKNGEIVEYADIESSLTAKEKNKNEELIFTISLDNIVSLGR